VESDKSVVEVEAIESGTLHIVLGPEAGDIPVGEVIAYLLAEGEAPPAGGGRAAEPKAIAVAAADGSGPRPAVELRPNRPPSSPAARRRAGELGVDWRMAVGTGPEGRIKERDVIRLAESATAPVSVAAEKVEISPLARQLAEAVGLDVGELARSHPGKRLERADVEQAIRQAISGVQPQAGSASTEVAARTASPSRQPMSHLRRLIGERMSQSAHTTAPVTLTTQADATDLVKIREGLKADPQTKVVPSYNVLFARLAAAALAEHPDLNASIDGDEIVHWNTVNIGIAVDTERGLVVPVVLDVQAKSIRELAPEVNALLTRAAEGKALPDELTRGTFTITNLGYLDVDAFTPIINPPECAVLGVGRLLEQMVVVDGEPAIRTMVTLSLTFDHRLVDGAPAARFLQRVKQLIEQPYLWLM
jgi:pyruvate dehydrogenase E2 component (dihydrolipoamide acetyltransferase)